MSTVLVTGGAGFIGSNLAGKLQNEGYEVKVLDNFSTGRQENLTDIKEIELIKGDLRDIETVKMSMENVDFVFHQAALASVSRSVKDPQATNEVNVTGTLNVLNSAKESDVKKVIYASSSSAYGDTPTLPKSEDMLPSPLSPYAVSKLTGEYYSRVFHEIYGLETVSLRYFNVYGPKQDPKSEYAAVVPKFITAMLNQEPPTIFGDGEQTRDFTYIKDVVQANILAIKHGGSGEVFNIGSGERVTINNLAEKIGKILTPIKPINTTPRQGDVKHSLADISIAKKVLKYNPKYSLEAGLKETIEWYKHGH